MRGELLRADPGHPAGRRGRVSYAGSSYDLECFLEPLSPVGGSDEPTEGQTSRPRVRRADRGSDEPTEEGGSGRVRG
jgi:hypothetical protein